jgi:alpha-tubulin suppressor-like RCC1 family protein
MKPTLVEDFGKANKKVQLISAGAHHSVIMTQQGDVYCCGSNTDG